MSLDISTQKNKKLKIVNSANHLDKILAEDLPEPLPKYSGFMWIISGAAGSGKTTLMTSAMSARKRNGVRQSYRKLFDKIIICSPTLGQGKSMKNDPFYDVPGDQKFKVFNNEVMDEIYEMCEANRDNDEHSVLILDDIGSQLRKSAGAEKQLVKLIQNRRHVFTSIFCLVQRFRDIPPGIRNNVSHFTTFRPKNMLEEEAICSEMLPFAKKHWRQLMSYVFDNDNMFSFLMVDLSLKQTNKYKYYNGLDLMNIESPT